jgi:hypothetical protein
MNVREFMPAGGVCHLLFPFLRSNPRRARKNIMPAHNPDKVQELIMRVSALNSAVERCLKELSIFYGDEAREKIKSLRDELIDKFKRSDIPAEREMEHAQIVGLAIDTIKLAFSDFV